MPINKSNAVPDIITISNELNNIYKWLCANNIYKWLCANKICLNADKTKYMDFVWTQCTEFHNKNWRILYNKGKNHKIFGNSL